MAAHSTLSVGYQHLRGLHLIISVNQNVPSCAAVGTNDGCRPNLTYGNDSQYSSLADSHYDGLHVSFVQRPVTGAALRVSYTYSKALDDVSEFFFSAPINNFNIWQDYGRSDDDQRDRLVFEGTVHTSMGAASTTWERVSHGFQLSTSAAVLLAAAVQHHHRREYRPGDRQRAPPSTASSSIATPDPGSISSAWALA